MDGIKPFAREVLQMPVRVGAPRDIEGFVDRVSSAAFATSIGLLQWGWKQQEAQASTTSPRSGSKKSNPLGGLFGWARGAILPG
jgi:cell division protein FtsA